MDFKHVTYERSFGTAEQIPASTLPEVSFAGRSNVGKSSLINKLFNRKNLARVSTKPGKTATINFFSSDEVRFVDLPGYGYAQVSRKEQERWADLIEGYFNMDRHFSLVVSLIDIRHAASTLDEQMLNFLQEMELPYVVALTKADKLSRQQQLKQSAALRKQLNIDPSISMIATSAVKGTGIDNLRAAISHALRNEAWT